MYRHHFISTLLITIVFSLGLKINCFSREPDSILQNRADSLYNVGDYSAAKELFVYLHNKTNEIDEEKGKNAFKAAKVFSSLGKKDSALIWYNNASDCFNQIKKWDNYYITQGQIAGLMDSKGDYNSAIDLMTGTVNHFKKQNDTAYVINTLNLLALSHYHNGNIEKTLTLYSEAIDWAGTSNDFLKAKCYNQLGNIWADDLNDENKALEYYRKSLSLKIRSSASKNSISYAFNNVGISHKNLGRLDSAMFYYQKSLQAAIESNDILTRLSPLINIANLHKKQGDFESSINTFKKALEVAKSGTVKQQASLHINIAIYYNELRNYNSALEHLSIAQELTNTSDILVDKRDIYLQMAIAQSGLNNFEKAFHAQEKVTLLNDSIHKREREQEIANLLLKHESVEKDNALLEQKQIIQQKELEIKKQTIWLISFIGILIILSIVTYYFFQRKNALARQAALELKLADEKERIHLQEERLRISRDLHDNIGSYLTLINASVEQMPNMPPKELSKGLPKLQKTLSLSMRELRKTVWLLNNRELSVEAIALRLRDFFKPLSQNGVKIIIQTKGNVEHLLTDIEATHLFRIIQEAVNNALKHSSANTISIQLQANEKICFSIEDDGVGFEVSSVKKGNGLHNINSRIKELRGSVQIESNLDKGTIIKGCF